MTALKSGIELTLPETLFRISGARVGPYLRVVGPQELLSEIAADLARLPSLAYLRGSIEISTDKASADNAADDVLDFFALTSVRDGKGVAKAYWLVLSRAASLGMISGRGIPRALPSSFDLAA